MQTQCCQDELDLGSCGGRKVVGAFDGGAISSNGGVVLLAGADRRLDLAGRLTRCFTDWRDPGAVRHGLADLLRQRIFGLALGYEDLNDHDALRFDPALTAALGRPEGVLAGKSTLNRLEHAAKVTSDPRHHRLDHDPKAIERLFVELFLQAHTGTLNAAPPTEIVLDLDATDDPLYGEQEGRHFHGYYDSYCYLPLYIFCGRHLLAAKLRSSAKGAADGACEELARIVAQIRAEWPKTRIIVRADSGFCNDEIMSWCEANTVDYVLGLAGNDRLISNITNEIAEAERTAIATGEPARVYKDFQYRTLKSWSTDRRVIGKAEFTHGEANPRFIVTSLGWLPSGAWAGSAYLYETVYCARGEMENRLKECQGDLFADRTPTPTIRANQLRLWLSSLAYVLMCAVRRLGLGGTRLARATCGSIRLALLKIGARVTISVRRVKLSFASSCPDAATFTLAASRLCG